MFYTIMLYITISHVSVTILCKVFLTVTFIMLLVLVKITLVMLDIYLYCMLLCY